MLKLLCIFFKNTKMINARRICVARGLLVAIPPLLGLGLCLVLPTDLLRGIALFGGIGLMFVFVFHNGSTLMHLGLIARMLKDQSYDRKYFVPSKAPASRSEWERVVLGRAERMKFRTADSEVPLGKHAPSCFGVKKASSAGSDDLECFALLYSVDALDRETYHTVLGDARKRIRNFPSRDEKKHKMRHFKVSYGTAAAVVILADTVDSEVMGKVKETFEVRDGTLYPAVVDCGAARVYMNGEKHWRILCDTDAQKLVARLVFGTRGSLPREGGEQTDEYRKLYERLSRQTFGEFLGESKAASDSFKESEKRYFEEMREGEFRFDDGILYGMAEGKLMSLTLFPEDESDEPMTIPPSTAGRVLVYDPVFLSWDLPKRAAMSERDKEVYLPRMLRYVESIGYRVKKEDEE